VSPALARRVAIVVCATGIAGMIVTNIAGSAGGPVAFGLVVAAGAGALMLVTTLTTGPVVSPGEADVLGARVEERVSALVAAGADEVEVRALVSDAVRLGRARG
jgi:hypothetical protein